MEEAFKEKNFHNQMLVPSTKTSCSNNSDNINPNLDPKFSREPSPTKLPEKKERKDKRETYSHHREDPLSSRFSIERDHSELGTVKYGVTEPDMVSDHHGETRRHKH